MTQQLKTLPGQTVTENESCGSPQGDTHLPKSEKQLLEIANLRKEKKLYKAAVTCGDLDTICGFLARGFGTPTEVLAQAARLGYPDVVSEMLRMGADVSTRDNLPLLHAATGGHFEIVDLLLVAGADPNSRDGKAFLESMEASHWMFADPKNDERAKIALRLLEVTTIVPHGPDLILGWAVTNQHADTVRQILSRFPHTHQSTQSWLVYAASKNDVPALVVILESLPAIELCLGKALSAAVGANSRATAAALLQKGANPNDVDSPDLVSGVKHGSLELVELLVQKGPISTELLNPALCEASRHDYLEIVEYLLAHGAEPNAQDGVPLIFAACNNALKTVQVLLTAGASPRAHRRLALRVTQRRNYKSLEKAINRAILEQYQPRYTVGGIVLPQKLLAAKLVSALRKLNMLSPLDPVIPIDADGNERHIRFYGCSVNFVWLCGLVRRLAANLTRRQMINAFGFLLRVKGLPKQFVPAEVTANLL